MHALAGDICGRQQPHAAPLHRGVPSTAGAPLHSRRSSRRPLLHIALAASPVSDLDQRLDSEWARVAGAALPPEADAEDAAYRAALEANEWLRAEHEPMTDEQVDDLIDAAAGFISVLDELRPLDPKTYNPCYEVWRVIAAIPPPDRPRLLQELEPGSLRTLWKASMARYVLDGERAGEIFEGHSVWDDFPLQPGEVVTYDGRCEHFVFTPPSQPLQTDAPMQARFPRATPWLKPTPGSLQLPQQRFSQHFFRHAGTGQLHSRVILGGSSAVPGWLDGWVTPPVYNSVDIGLTLTLLSSDAGADVTIAYAVGEDGSKPLGLSKHDLPSKLWPAPGKDVWSPFSRSGRDYMRPAGPGVYVGCAYRRNGGKEGEPPAPLLQTDCVYFMLVRRV